MAEVSVDKKSDAVQVQRVVCPDVEQGPREVAT